MEYSNSQIREIIAEWVHSQRDRDVLCDRLINGLTFEKLAEKHDMSVSQIKRIVRKCGEAVFRHVPSQP